MKTSTKISRALRLILSVTALLACVTTVSAQELIKNGTFNSGKTNWQLGVYGANAQSTVSNNSYSTTITDGGSDTWRIQLTQGGIPQVNGETYTFSFEAQASSSRTFDAMVEKNGSPWTNYSASNNQTLTTTWQLFTYTYTHRGSNDNNARITFNMGNNNHDVQIRNVSLYNGVLVQHDLTTSVIGSGSITPEMGKFNNDEAITITATPDEGWGFVQWGGDITGTTNPSTIIMDDAKNIVAEFVQLPTYSLSVVANTGGSVTPQLGTYYEGTPLSITAAPDAGWEFVAFTGDVQSSNNPLSITISHDMNIEASFRELPKNVALNKPASASTIEGSSYSATQAVDGSMSSRWSSHFSDPQWIEIDLEETYQVSQIVLHWETAGASDYEVQVSDNRIDWTTIHTEKNGNAGVDNRSVDGVGRYIRMYGTQRTTQWGYSLLEFEVYGVLSSYTLSTSVTGNGTITPDGGTYTPGTTVSITATPAEGWEFIGWSGDLTGTEQSATLTIDGNKNITAVFTEIPYYALHTTITGEGTVTPASGSYIRGTHVTLTATPADGWEFEGWTGDVTSTDFSTSITMNSDKNITAVFTEIPYYALHTTITGEGTVTPTSGSYIRGTHVTLTATPADGWEFEGWTGDVTSTDIAISVTMDSDKNMSAVFTEIPQYSLTSDISGQGSISLRAGSFTRGTDLILTALPAEGWLFDRWNGDMSGTNNPETTTMNADKHVIAVFIETPNVAPIAHAGIDQTQGQNDLVTLDGSLSSDPDDKPASLTYSWIQLTGTPVTLTNANTVSPTFTAHEVGVLEFALVVSDGDLTSPEASVSITIEYSDGVLRNENGTIANDFGPIILRGFNLGNWLAPEGYLMHADIPGYKSPSEFHDALVTLLEDETLVDTFVTTWRQNFFNEGDLIAMKALGINSYRVPFQYRDIYDFGTNGLIEHEMAWLDSAATWGKRHGVYMILDMHGAPGGQNYMDHANVPPEPHKLFAGTDEDFEFYGARTAHIWKMIAERYAQSEYVAYDLINEPLVEDALNHWKLRELYIMITEAIRTVDLDHMIITEGNWWSSWLEPIGIPWDANMAYSTHNYWTEAPSPGRASQVTFAQNNTTPIWHGESGENSNVWFGIEINDLESHGIGWAWWTYKKLESVSGGIDVTMTDGYKAIVESWKGNGTVSPTEAYTYLIEQAVAVNTENGRTNISVLDALLRTDFLTTAIPWNNTLPQVPVGAETTIHIDAHGYDMGTQGVAYSDAEYIQESMTPVAWNSGWNLRNDGVDIYEDWDNTGEYFIGSVVANEWVQYTFEAMQPGAYAVIVHTATGEDDKSIHLVVNGSAIATSSPITNTNEWNNWTENSAGIISLESGIHTLRIFFETENINFKSFEIRHLGIEDNTLLVTHEGLGSVTPSQGFYHYDRPVTIAAEAINGWLFDHWEGDISGTENPVTITMDGDKNVHAVFVENPNALPTADAGLDQSVTIGGEVILDGTGSFDPDNTPLPLTYAWSQTAGPIVILNGASSDIASFNPTQSGVYRFTLSVFDGELTSNYDEVIISVEHTEGPLRRNGMVIENDNGPILLRGLNIANWLFPLGSLMGSDWDGYRSPSEFRTAVQSSLNSTTLAAQFYATWRDNFFNEADVQSLKQEGFNSLRIPFQYKDIYDIVTGALKEETVHYLDSCAQWGKRHGVYMIFDMHGAPGGQSDNAHADYPTEMNTLFNGTIEEFEANIQLSADIWQAIAERYASSMYVAYDLLHEPQIEDALEHQRLRDYYQTVTAAIRTVDVTHLIIAQGLNSASWIEPIGDRFDENMAASTHNYWSAAPNPDRASHVTYAITQDLPLWHGESGENSNMWYGLEVNDLESQGIGWSWFTFKKLNSVTGVYSSPITAEYTSLLEYWNGGSPLSFEEAFTALMTQAESMTSSESFYNRDVIDALIRPTFLTEAVAWNNTIPEIPLTGTLSIPAVHYDMGAQGVAYSDRDYIQQTSEAAAWNRGWLYRNDGVDIELDWSTGTDYFVGTTDWDEWLQYTFTVPVDGDYSIVIGASTGDDNKAAHLVFDGGTAEETFPIINTTGWVSWQDNDAGTYTLTAGVHTVRVVWDSWAMNFKYLSITKQ